ncbi:MAG: M3 family oligoendopeptidase [Alphaproteobacteria bacterium]|nr:M3 family oligoendopeptidase [Alphaproteobacteria bacterium]
MSTPQAQQEQPAKTAEILPEWDLADLYPGPDAPQLQSDLDDTNAAAAAFKDRYQGKLAELSGAELAAAIGEYERIDETLARLMSFAQLLYAGDMSDVEIGRFSQNVQEKVTNISSLVLFFTLELNRLDDKDLDDKLADPGLARYRPWLRDIRVFRDHQLAEDMERLLHEKAVAGRSAWMRLFDETIAALRFPVDGQELTSTEALHLLSDPEESVRKSAAQAIGQVFGENIRTFALITNTLAKDKEIEDRWRELPRPVSARNLHNLVEDQVVDALVAAVRRAYPSLSHRYYALKAQWFGKDKLDHWDRNAPLPEQNDREITWDEARRAVIDAYGRFSPDMAAIGKRFFESRWIDAPVRPGKAPGAFSHSTVPSAHPYILLNYQGKTRDVMTLAHELGHGVHQVLAAEQGHLMSDTPLTLAETASVFGEMLTFRGLLDQESDAGQRRTMLALKVEDMLNTVVRQIAFYEFERLVHDARRTGELTPDQIGAFWFEVQSESLGPALRFSEEYQHFWAYIPHFIHAPFYVYAYAFGDCLVNSLYAVYQESEAGFAEKYLDMLRAGGTLRHKELLAPFGLDAGDPDFWDRGLGVIAGFIDELETLS